MHCIYVIYNTTESPPESPRITKIDEENWSLKSEILEPEYRPKYKRATANYSTLNEVPEQPDIWSLPNKVPEKSEITDKLIPQLYWGHSEEQRECFDDDCTEPGIVKVHNSDIGSEWSDICMNIEQGSTCIQGTFFLFLITPKVYSLTILLISSAIIVFRRWSDISELSIALGPSAEVLTGGIDGEHNTNVDSYMENFVRPVNAICSSIRKRLPQVW